MLTALLLCAALLTPGDTAGPDWFYGSFRSALSDAAKADKLVMLVFLADESAYSQKLAAETLVDERVLAKLGELIAFRPDLGSRRGDTLVERYGVESYPTIVFARGDGGIEDAIYGFIPADPLLGELRRIVDRQGTVSAHQKLVDEEPENLSARFQLASILGNLGAHEEAQQQLDAIVALDPEGTHVVSARMLWSERKAAVAEAAGSEDTSGWDLAPLYAHVEQSGNAEFRYEARVDLANLELARGDADAGLHQFQLAWADVPPAAARSFAFDVANFCLTSTRTDESGAFALDLALFALEAAERQRDEGLARLALGASGDDAGDAGNDGDSDNGDSEADAGADADGARSSADQRAVWDRWLAEHHSLLARAYAAEGLPDLAAESMARAVELDGESADYVEQLATFRAALN